MNLMRGFYWVLGSGGGFNFGDEFNQFHTVNVLVIVKIV